MTPDQEAIDALAEARAEENGNVMTGWPRHAAIAAHRDSSKRILARLRSRGFDIVRKE